METHARDDTFIKSLTLFPSPSFQSVSLSALITLFLFSFSFSGQGINYPVHVCFLTTTNTKPTNQANHPLLLQSCPCHNTSTYQTTQLPWQLFNLPLFLTPRTNPYPTKQHFIIPLFLTLQSLIILFHPCCSNFITHPTCTQQRENNKGSGSKTTLKPPPSLQLYSIKSTVPSTRATT